MVIDLETVRKHRAYPGLPDGRPAGRDTAGAGPDGAAPAGVSVVLPGGDQLTFSARSSITKLVCWDESSVPVNLMVTVWPAKEVRSRVRCT